MKKEKKILRTDSVILAVQHRGDDDQTPSTGLRQVPESDARSVDDDLGKPVHFHG